ncbi:MAG: biotin/lipoyl-binding protein [Oscillospiraceae bacterium]|jgi:glutaconyl-CoA decarboxylase|nr:biotin/lipoyl-binding protein [Oscillospiraceae bacterium]
MKYHVTLGGKTYEVEVEKGEAILIGVADAAAPAPVPAPAAAPTPAPVAAAAPTPAPAPAAAAGEVVSSPMPGTVMSVKVTAGQAVKKGTVLVVFEAMKMENEILASRDASVGQVFVAQGASIDTGTPLLTLV